MADKPRRDPKDRPLKSDKRVSLAPLDFERALGGLLAAGPHPKDDKPEPTEGKEKAPPKRRRKPSADLIG
jgi:hypothetical protein